MMMMKKVRIKEEERNHEHIVLKAVLAFAIICACSLLYVSNVTPDGGGRAVQSSTSNKNDRSLSISYGNGTCKWQPPERNVPEDIDFWKTIIVGYPSGDKRLTFLQMEALTGWPAKGDFGFKYLGMSNHPFIKTNYPHHNGVWSWEDAGDQVVMVVGNIRRTMIEYHHILWDLGYINPWKEGFEPVQNLYEDKPPLEDFLDWRDLRILDEIYWYGWFIDYWMEGGLQRDIYSHNLTTPDHWEMLMNHTAHSREEQEEAFVPTETKSYDPRCLDDEVSNGCVPVKIISTDRLLQNETGPAETHSIAELLMGHDGMAEYVIEEDAWDCIWNETIINKKGLKIAADRPGHGEDDYMFSAEMLDVMIQELNRLIAKYESDEWNELEVAQELVELIVSHRDLIENERNEMNRRRELKDTDILGPLERKRRKENKMKKDPRSLKEDEGIDPKDHSEYFRQLELYITKRRNEIIHQEVMRDDEE